MDEMERSDYEVSDGSTVELERDVGVRAERDTPEDQDPEEEAGNVTDDSEGENGEDRAGAVKSPKEDPCFVGAK